MRKGRPFHTFSIFRNFLSRIISKEFLIFLFFLVLSGAFWLVMTLNETYEREFSIPLRMADVPRNVVITSSPVPGWEPSRCNPKTDRNTGCSI